jgi:hypothetical protein
MGMLTIIVVIAAIAVTGITVSYKIIERITRPPRRPWNWRR